MANPAPAFCIGTTANLLHGFKPVWNAADPSQVPFYPPLQQEFIQFPIDTSNTDTSWGSLQLDLCDSPAALLEKLYPCQILMDAGDPSTISPGALGEAAIRLPHT